MVTLERAFTTGELKKNVLFKEELRSELEAVEREFTSDALSVRKFSEAAKLLSDLVEDRQLAPFLTLEAYHLI